MTVIYRHTGRIGIDYALTGHEGEEFARFEVTPTPADLDAWFAQSDLAIEHAASTDQDLALGRRLRFAIWHAAQAAAAGAPLPDEHVVTIEAAAAAPPLVPRIDGGWREPTARAALSTIARDVIEMLADPAQHARVRICAADNCPVPFYDGSRPGRRRWCEDARCGDRHRQRTHRQRRKDLTT
ncbi:MAG: CGNR zinc finger domain-containing protein [Solirubrobacteraceae bacterium]|nr:CGNR zinc finger domain-containing protein [Solirubrobacteraceae bacterium]